MWEKYCLVQMSYLPATSQYVSQTVERKTVQIGWSPVLGDQHEPLCMPILVVAVSVRQIE